MSANKFRSGFFMIILFPLELINLYFMSDLMCVQLLSSKAESDSFNFYLISNKFKNSIF